jgi:spermidine synthase
VIPRELVGTATIPGHTAVLRCYRHDGAFQFWVDRTELMTSRVHGSEEQLAELALQRLGPCPAPRVLVGGLGMGFTLARTLALVGSDAVVEVAELVPEVVAWNRDLLGHCAGHPLRDPRTRLVMGDVRGLIAAARAAHDVVLLDVDNGPEGLTHPDNDGLYDPAGIARLREAIRPGGVLAVWSSTDNAPFRGRLRQGGFEVSEHRVHARGQKGPRRVIWVGTRR